MSIHEKTREEIEKEITDQEAADKGFITGTLIATANMFLNGEIPDKEGYKQLDKALKLMDEYGMTNEELGIYVQYADPSISEKVKKFASLVFNKGANV